MKNEDDQDEKNERKKKYPVSKACGREDKFDDASPQDAQEKRLTDKRANPKQRQPGGLRTLAEGLSRLKVISGKSK